MKSLVIYYSFTGHTKTFAENLAKEIAADIIEVKETKKRSMFTAFLCGCFAAMRQKTTKVQPFFADYPSYGKVIICAPVWAGHPAPAFNNIVESLPKGKDIELYMISGGGTMNMGKNKVIAKIEKQGCKVIDYKDIKI